MRVEGWNWIILKFIYYSTYQYFIQKYIMNHRINQWPNHSFLKPDEWTSDFHNIDLNKDSPTLTNFSNELKCDNSQDIFLFYYLLVLLLSIKDTFKNMIPIIESANFAKRRKILARRYFYAILSRCFNYIFNFKKISLVLY